MLVSAESVGSEPLGHGEGCARRCSAHGDCDTQLDERQPKSKEHLLFPGAKGADFRSMTSVTKPFARVAKEIGVDSSSRREG